MLNKKHPDPGQVVLAYVQSESTWLPLQWMPEDKIWSFSILSGRLTAIFQSSDVKAWIEEDLA